MKAHPLPGVRAPADGSALGWLLRVNLLLGTFNLLPALPMDGGRILRAALALRMSNLAATRIASRTARGIAALMILYGITRGQWMLVLIGGFVWSTAKTELVRAMLRDAFEKRQGGWGDPAGLDPRPIDPQAQNSPDGEWIQPPVRRHPRGPE